jgi:hypothetical protein
VAVRVATLCGTSSEAVLIGRDARPGPLETRAPIKDLIIALSFFLKYNIDAYKYILSIILILKSNNFK